MLLFTAFSSLAKELYNPKTFIIHAALLGQACAHCRKFPTAASRRSLDRVSVPVWPFTLSGRLRIVALVGPYPTNQLMRHEPISLRSYLSSLKYASQSVYSVLANLSISYPHQKGRLLMYYSPVRYQKYCYFPFNLHVLGMPPALILSQDQTLLLFYLFALAFYSYLKLLFADVSIQFSKIISHIFPAFAVMLIHNNTMCLCMSTSFLLFFKSWCPEPESNWHGSLNPQDFKSCASTCSAIWAKKMVIRTRFELVTP